MATGNYSIQSTLVPCLSTRRFKSLKAEDKALVGELVVTCAGLEHLAIIALALALGTSYRKVDLVFKRAPHGAVLDDLKGLAPMFLSDGKLRERWSGWVEASRDISKRRNDVVHTIWSSVGPDDLEGLSRSPFRDVRMPREDLEKLVKDAGLAFKEGLYLMLGVLEFLGPKGYPAALE
jgi:hypothetical protein